MERRPSDTVGLGEDTTSVMDELLAHQAGTGSERAASMDE
jgi:hypothetical protein